VIIPDLPRDEVQRLFSLRSYAVLDSAPETVFDELAELAAAVCNTPIALVSLIDEARQWFKARVGLPDTETGRDVSFCAHAILQPGIFQVADTMLDTRFADNPLVTGPPYIRFYAGAPLFDQAGHGLGTLCVIDQVPRELNAAQQQSLGVLRTHVVKLLELRRKARELELINRELEAFDYTISHDLRAPLRAITGFGEILRDDHQHELTDEARKLLDHIMRAAQRMDRLTTDLLDLSRLSRNPLVIGTVDLGALTHEAVLDLRAREPERVAKVVIEPALLVAGDRGLLRVVIDNLLSNAWKFTRGRTPARIEIGKQRRDDRTEYFVRDNGVGFDMRYAQRLFQPFQRMHPGSEYPGTGIGLATVMRIVRRHGGTMRAESAVNAGTLIAFTLEAARDQLSG
jgi:signal transduction histidine kinase